MGKYRESPVGLECNVKAEETRNKIWMQVVYGEMDPRKHPHLPCPPGWAKGNGGLVEGGDSHCTYSSQTVASSEAMGLVPRRRLGDSRQGRCQAFEEDVA